MSQFFDRQYSQEDLQRQLARRRQSSGPGMTMGPPQMSQGVLMNPSGMVDGDSLDDIIMQNNQELHRRQSYPQHFDDGRKSSMVEFGALNESLSDFQFGQQPTDDITLNDRRQSLKDLSIASSFDMTANLGMNGAGAAFTSIAHTNPLSIDTTNSYQTMSADMMGNMMYPALSGDTTPMDTYLSSPFTNAYSAGGLGPMPLDYSMPLVPDNSLGVVSSDQHNGGGDGGGDILTPGLEPNVNMPTSINLSQSVPDYASPIPLGISQNVLKPDTYQTSPMGTSGASSPSLAIPGPQPPKPQPNFQNIYSSSGFDMLGALMRVATRKNPEINIGAVDMSCAFVVCDVTQSDLPIIYVSEIFERLTGYSKHEVLGRNCRFLQAPDGKVMAGVKRTYVDDDSVFYLKTRIGALKEAQRSLINYRKGGQPFTNLLTMIPIPWDGEEIRYIVGFQVDLVEQPGSVAGKGEHGSYTVNYSQRELPRYVFHPPEGALLQPESGQTISRDEVSTALANFNHSPDSDLSRRMWDKVLLENTDDVVHVLSLKGLFLYVSPSSKKVLEYEASELVGTALSSVCHPSDIVPVTRELKDTSAGSIVDVVFRIRRKKSGYTWFESHGSLCVEQGKGRKYLVLVGRERPVYAISRHDIEAAGGIGENELWTKLSTSGMFLFVSSNVRILLDRQPDELIGTSIQALMRSESKVEFGRSLERARTGKRIVYKHEIMNKRGQVLQAQTTLYPGDASEGQKPTFLVGQTRLLKPSARGATASSPNYNSSGSRTAGGLQDSIGPMSNTSGLAAQMEARNAGTPNSASSVTRENLVTQAGGAGLIIGSQDAALAAEENIFDELKTTRCTSWQFELRQMEKSNRLLAEELASLANKKKRKRRKGAGNLQRDCANCHTRVTPEWRRGPSGNRDLCNSCGLRWAKQNGRVSPRTSSRGDAASKTSASPIHTSALQKETTPSSSASVITERAPNKNSMEKQLTTESHSAYAPGQGFLHGGPNGITKIDEKEES